MCWKPGRFECIPARRHGGYWEGGEQVLLPAGAQGGLDHLQDMQVVGHFTVHGLSVSVSVNTGATPGVAADIHTNSAVIDAVTGFIAATMAADAAAVHDATLTFVNAFMNVDPATAAAMHFLSAISVMPEHAPAPAPALPIGAPIPVLGATAPPTTLSAWEMEGVGGEIEGVGGEEEEEAAEEEQMVVQEEQIAVQEGSGPEVSQEEGPAEEPGESGSTQQPPAGCCGLM